MLSGTVASVRRILGAEIAFAISMMAATSLGLFKAIGLAGILPPDAFGLYITAFGVATFLATLASFGAVEATIKLYPRLYLAGDMNAIRIHASRTRRRLAVRVLCSGLVTVGVKYLVPSVGRSFSVQDLIVVLLIALVAANLLLTASVVRAIGSVRALQLFALLRGAIPVVAVLPVAITFDWRLTLAAELVAMLMVYLIMASVLRRHRGPHKLVALSLEDDDRATGGFKLYLAGLAGATIPYGGRSVVLAVAGPATAGAFGVIGLILQVGIMLAGVLTQKLGPQMIKDAATGGLNLRAIAIPATLMIAMAALAVAVLPASTSIGAADQFWASYGIGPGLLAVTGLALASPIYLMFQFALIARNEEHLVLASSVGSVLMCFGGFMATVRAGAPLAGFVASVIGAYLFQLLFMGTRLFAVRSLARSGGR